MKPRFQLVENSRMPNVLVPCNYWPYHDCHGDINERRKYEEYRAERYPDSSSDDSDSDSVNDSNTESNISILSIESDTPGLIIIHFSPLPFYPHPFYPFTLFYVTNLFKVLKKIKISSS